MLSTKEHTQLLSVLKARFEKNSNRHKDLQWAPIEAKLEGSEKVLRSLQQMEATGGEPDVIGYDKKADQYLFCDCAAESPKERRSICYDREAQQSRKEHAPKNNAVDMAADMGIELLTEEQYRALQSLGKFDTKTSSWIQTPEAIRKLGGALFCDYRYGHVFVYHNSAQSYYSSRGFRGLVKL